MLKLNALSSFSTNAATIVDGLPVNLGHWWKSS